MQENWDDTEHSSKPERNALEGCSEERTIVPQFVPVGIKSCESSQLKENLHSPENLECISECLCSWYQALATGDGVSG